MVDVPVWLAQVAVAERVTPALVELVAAGAGVRPPRDLTGFLERLTSDGVLRRDDDDPTGDSYRLDEDYQSAMLENLAALPGGIPEVRDGLIRLGVESAPLSLSGQLVIWAYQNADWTLLSELWLQFPQAIWSSMASSAVKVFALVPTEARRAHPALSQAAALTAPLAPAQAGTFNEQAFRKVRQEGRLLHSGWASLNDLDDVVRAGSLWMMAQRTMAGHPDPLDDAWATRGEIAAVIDKHTLAGNSPASTVQTLFHAASAATSFLRGNIYQARSDCEQAMMLSRPGDVWALVAAGLEALALSIAGNPRGCERAVEWYFAQAPACGAFAAIAAPYVHLALALAAIRLLDRDRAEESLGLAAKVEEGSEFWSAFACIRSMNDLTWRKPDYGLARLEAAVSSNPSGGVYETLSDALAFRARVDLLSCAGRINQADALLKGGRNSRLNRYHLVSEARMHLCSHNGAQAIRVADEGVHDPEVVAPARAHLCAIRSAGLLLVGADASAVRTALREACTLSTELADVLPFVFIPASLKSELLRLHDQLDHESPCILDDVVIRERLGRVWDNLDSAPTVIRLTGREKVLLPLLATPATVDALAKQLQVSVNTLRKQVVTLRHKFGAPNRAAMISSAQELGLLSAHER